ncbi:MAG: class I SAM-dependent methyltransferase [Nitrososphaera sp.]|nr:class I SAM-dependent methyltransferase [Nitrososphaera sp.]
MNEPFITKDPFEEVLNSAPIELARYQTLKTTLMRWRDLFAEKTVLDFGASSGLSTYALLIHGAKSVIGIEPDKSRMVAGNAVLQETGLGRRAKLLHIADTRSLPFKDESFVFILANGVIEHIPQPRYQYVRELWRLVSPRGYLMINETPNKYLPKEMHTTNLWFNHWLPKNMAYRRAVREQRFAPDRKDWDSSGWRGIGYFELVSSLPGYFLIPERTRTRHRILSAMRIPASILDPYPTWVFRKI